MQHRIDKRVKITSTSIGRVKSYKAKESEKHCENANQANPLPHFIRSIGFFFHLNSSPILISIIVIHYNIKDSGCQ